MPPEPPQNGEYLIAAYVIATVILLTYCLGLLRKAKRIIVQGRHSERSEESPNETPARRSR